MNRPAIAVIVGFFLALAGACTGNDPEVGVTPNGSGDGGSSTPADAFSEALPPVGENGDAADAGNEFDGGDANDASDAAPCTPPGPPVVVFLDRAGGTWIPGATDSRVNQSAVVSSSTSVPAWTVASASWTTLMACVAQKFKPFDIKVTDVDPVGDPHIEVVFAPGTLTLFSGATSIAPMTCAVVPNSVAFVSTTYSEANLDNGCAAVASVVGSSLGLEPVTACPDAMSYPQTSCATAGFTNVALSCGTTAAAPCVCQGGTTQNSYARVLAVTGPACL